MDDEADEQLLNREGQATHDVNVFGLRESCACRTEYVRIHKQNLGKTEGLFAVLATCCHRNGRDITFISRRLGSALMGEKCTCFIIANNSK